MQKRVIRRRKPLVKESETRPKTTTVLSFNATIISNNTDDQLREFMVNFCIENSSFAVYEKVVPNSGFPGGKFIKESKATSPETGKPYTPDEVHIGATIVAASTRDLDFIGSIIFLTSKLVARIEGKFIPIDSLN